jgi:transposase
MEQMIERCAGLDVHKDTVVACVRVAQGSGVSRETRTFGTTTGELERLRDWLIEHHVTCAAMEATGVYWLPVWHVLEGTVELILANPAHIKAVPGRKTDVKDAEWLAELLAHGLITASFVPPTVIQQARHSTRDRVQFTSERTRHVQRIQKVLQDANIKIDSVISDLMGVSGRAFLGAIVAGETDPERLADYAHARLKASRSELVEALRGVVTDHHRKSIARHLHVIETLDAAIVDLDAEVVALLEPFRREVELLTSVPGVGETTAQVLVAEIGADMSRFPSPAHLVSWAGLCPKSDMSAGKKRSTRLKKGGRWLKNTLVQAAWGAARTKNSHLRTLFLRIKSRRGPKKAIIAVAAEMLRSIWYMLRRGEPYKEPGDSHLDEAGKEQAARRLVRKLKKLGYDVTLPMAPK